MVTYMPETVLMESLWIGLVEVCPREDAEYLREASGAFVNVIAWTAHTSQFSEKVKVIMDELRMAIIAIEEAEPLANRGPMQNEEIIDMADRAKSNPHAIIYGTFQTWREQPS